MPPKLRNFIANWIINTLAVLVAAEIIPGFQWGTFTDLLVASLLLGIFNAFLRPILMLLALPLLIVTLGLFTLVINALLLYFVGYLLRPHFSVDTFWHAFFGALIIWIISTLLGVLTGRGRASVTVRRGGPPGGPGTGGPVIDV